MHVDLGLPLWVVASICVAVLIGLFGSLDGFGAKTNPVLLSSTGALRLIAGELVAIGVAVAHGFVDTTRGMELLGQSESLERSLAITLTASYIIVIYLLVFSLATNTFALRIHVEPRGVINRLGPIGFAPAVVFVIAATLGELSGHDQLDLDKRIIGWTQVVALLLGHVVAVLIMHVQCRGLVEGHDRVGAQTPLVVALCASLLGGLWVFSAG